ncbi:MAG: dienelactone hydrolase family protein, partial [Planctomycetota bacterium]|nr:dienelactone hydrolase family protein [Planctomycetota bacterium]
HFERDGEKQQETVRYQLFLPSFFEKGEPLPLMLFLHGAGERGEDLDKVKQWGPPRFVPDRPDFPFIVVSPQCPKGQWWDIVLLTALIDQIEQTYPIDADRIVVTGLSMGGYGSWRLAAATPERFAAIAPVCGGGDPETADSLVEIPVWNFHGSADNVVPEQRSLEMVAAIVAAGGERVKHTSYAGVGHDSWKRAYAGDQLWNWLLAQRRGASADPQISEERLSQAGENRPQIERALASGCAAQRQAMHWLVQQMPRTDLASLDSEYLLENARLAVEARRYTRWKQTIPDEIFLDAVLPYATINERRDRWRADFRERFLPLVAESTSPSEAAATLNQKIFEMVGVKYSTKRPKADQSPYESMESGLASCTGLSVLLIDACRSVGVPARFVGTPLWSDGSGNHSWVEIWDDGWHFTGAAEPTGDDLDRAWFTGRTSKASRDNPRNGIYAVTWRSSPLSFPMVWAPENSSVRASDVTDRYTRTAESTSDGKSLVRFRIIDGTSGDRCQAPIQVLGPDAEVLFEGESRDERFDANDHVSTQLVAGEKVIVVAGEGSLCRVVSIRIEETEQLVSIELKPRSAAAASAEAIESLAAVLAICGAKTDLDSLPIASVPLTRDDSDAAASLIWQAHATLIASQRASEMEKRELTIGELKMPFWYQSLGTPPATGRSLWISLHGGGGAPAEVNDGQWENQKKLYRPEEGIYLAPRAPTNSWNLWHQPHIDQFFDRLIENLIVFEQVDPNRVYILGYSAGGDGVYQIGPRMADRWAAVAMMAGHPNDARPESLRNTPFTLHMGGQDEPYNRNGQAVIWQKKLADLASADPGGYPHWVEIYDDKGHWMDREDAAAIPWMAGHTRNLRPKKIVWQQDDVTHDRFYWLKVPQAKPRSRVVVEMDGQKIKILEAEDVTQLTMRFDDSMLDLDESVWIEKDGKPIHECILERNISTIARTMGERGDPIGMFSAEVSVEIPQKKDSE